MLKAYENKRLTDKEGMQDVFFKSMTAQPDGTLLTWNGREDRFVVAPANRTSRPMATDGAQ